MGKAHVTAIIQALQETIENLSVNGCSSRAKITNPTVDSQYVQALEDDYGDEIDTIVENIPDDPPVPTGPIVFVLLPKSPADSFGGYNTVVEACDLDGNYIPYSRVENFITGNSSMICNCFNNSSTYGFVDTDVSVSSCIINNSGNVAWKSTRYYQNSWCSFCAFISDPTGVTVVDIFESQAPYRCFKSFYYDGKYFVLDKIQKQWVSDLSTLGYQTTPVDGVVYPFGAFFLTEISFSGYVSKYAKTWDNQYIGCNDGLGYSCVGAYRVNGTSATSQFSFIRENNSTSLCLKNESSSAYIYSAKFATQSKLPSVTKFNAKTLSGSSTAQAVTLQQNVISRWLYETIAQSSYMGFTPAVMNVSDGTNVIARKGVSALFDNTDGGQGTYSSYCISIRNDTGSDLTCNYARVALCMSNLITVTVVNVYNSSNDAYNAFAYNDGTTDYYYVLDGVQTDWTEDLSSIGYTLTPVFPTVSITGDISVGNWVYPVGGEASLASNATVTVKDDFSSGSTIAFNTNVCYAVRNWYTDSSNTGTNGSISVANVSNNLCVKNDTNSTLNFYAARIGVCYNNQATVVTVYNSQNNPYNAFQYTLNGTDYYYVLDGTQTDWTDDLSSIGYSLTKNLPTVQNVQCWLNQNQGSASVAASFTRLVYDANNSRIPYSSSLLYCVFLLSATETLDGTFEVVQSTNDNIAISRSNGTNSTTVYTVFYASCSDKTATIIDVYDSQNKAFKAFKYTLDGVDYYRVMEWQNTHPDWVTDLSSIGYHLPAQLPTIWQSRAGVSPSNQTISAGGISFLAQDGQIIRYYSDYSYAFRRWVKFSSVQRTPGEIINDGGFIAAKNTGSSDVTGVYSIDYAICSSNQAEVVTVYNSSNEAFNAFKYTTNGTDYYYVLDEVQTDWTDYLEAIGYHLPAILYLNSSSAKTDTYMSYLSPYYLYRNGSQVVYSSSLVLKNVYNAAGNVSTARFSLTVINGVVALRCDSGSVEVCYCEILGL